MSDGQSENGAAAEWVTVPEAARRLGLSERQTRRMVAKLPDTSRTQAGQTPVRVRVDALHELRGQAAEARHTPDTSAPEAGQDAGRGPDNAGHVEAVTDAALVAQLQSENAFLRDALKSEQENTRAALAELSRAREQAAVLIAAVGAGRLQLAPTEPIRAGMNEGEASNETVKETAAGPAFDSSQEATHGDLRADAGQIGQNVGSVEKRPFWAFWKKEAGG